MQKAAAIGLPIFYQKSGRRPLIKERRLKPPRPSKSCRVWSCDVYTNEAFLVLRASSIRQAG
ncbi:hypothetical protein ABE67_00410 [Cytobacillus firmus]|nr:hypothetical protein [Cytobacillus firmus]